MSRLTRDGTAEPVSRDQILRHERGQGKIHFSCSADHVQDWQPYPVDPYSCYMCDHTIQKHTCYFSIILFYVRQIVYIPSHPCTCKMWQNITREVPSRTVLRFTISSLRRRRSISNILTLRNSDTILGAVNIQARLLRPRLEILR